jgi:hypothetical protein
MLFISGSHYENGCVFLLAWHPFIEAHAVAALPGVEDHEVLAESRVR